MFEETERNKKWQEPEKLMEDYSETQKLLDELQKSEGANIELAVHIDDGDTYTSLDNIAVVTVTEDEMDKILESSKISDIVNENRWISSDSVLDRNELNRLRRI